MELREREAVSEMRGGGWIHDGEAERGDRWSMMRQGLDRLEHDQRIQKKANYETRKAMSSKFLVDIPVHEDGPHRIQKDERYQYRRYMAGGQKVGLGGPSSNTRFLSTTKEGLPTTTMILYIERNFIVSRSFRMPNI